MLSRLAQMSLIVVFCSSPFLIATLAGVTLKTSVDDDKARGSTAGLSVCLVPSESFAGVPSIRYELPFEVILKNTSARPILLWSFDTKQGYDQISFRFTNTQTKQVYTVRRRTVDDDGYWKREQKYRKNHSEIIELAPGATFAHKVNLSDFASPGRAWSGHAVPNGNSKYQIVVDFAARASGKKGNETVWKGTTSSPPLAAYFVASVSDSAVAYLWNGLAEAALEKLKQDPTEVNRRDGDSCTPLHHASRFAYMEVLRYLLDHGADVNAIGYNDFTPLYFASEPEVAALILKYKPDLSASNSIALRHATDEFNNPRRQGEKAKWRKIIDLYLKAGADYDIVTAIRLNDLDRVKAILKASPEFANDFQDWTPLREAAQLGRLEICQYLVDNFKLDVNDFEGGVGYPIIKEALSYPRVVKLLIDHGADLQTRITWRGGRSGYWPIGDDATALHYAMDDGVPETVTLLLEAGIDPFASTRKPTQTALDVAALFERSDQARALLESPKWKAGEAILRQSVLDRCLCSSARNSAFTEWHGKPVEMIRLLLIHGANPKATSGGVSALRLAAEQIWPGDVERNGQVKKVVELLRGLKGKGASLDLYSAAAMGDEGEVVRCLKADPALANMRSSDGFSALHIAVSMD
jgi:ankyrin repeat protein